MILLELFLSFAKIGVMTFGGGMAMLPMLQREIVQKRSWATDEELLNCYAIGQCTPGIIAVNTASFIGYRKKGVLGAVVSTLGIITPSFLIITLLAGILEKFSSNIYVQKAFSGIRVAVASLVLVSIVRLVRTSIKNINTALVAILSLVLQLVLGVSPVVVTILAVLYGIVCFLAGRRKNASA